VKSLCLCLGLLLSTLPGIHAYDVKDVLFQMAERERSMKSIAFQFVQKITFTEMEQKTEVKGAAIFEKPNKMRIEKQIPQEQLTISNGKKVWIYTPAYSQVWVGEWKDWTNENAVPKGLLPLNDYVSALKNNFNLKLVEKTESPGTVTLRATPKNENVGYKMDLAISVQTWLPFETRVRTESAHVVTTLDEVKIDPITTRDTFSFRPPKGTDVIPLK